MHEYVMIYTETGEPNVLFKRYNINTLLTLRSIFLIRTINEILNQLIN